MTRDEFEVWLRDPSRQVLVMGVLNITPDSFSDGGRFADAASALVHGKELLAAGADLLDVGGESTRPGAERTGEEEQIRRVVPVIEGLRGEMGEGALMSIDTTRGKVARAALEAGAWIINDISAGCEDGEMLPLAGARRCPIVLMHMKGNPATMQINPTYRNVVEEVAGFLAERMAAAREAGVALERILLDPGIGFGKKVGHNLELLRRVGEFTKLGRPLVLGTSRKGFLGKIGGESDPGNRLFTTAASVAWCVANGAAVVRVHDVAEMIRVVRVIGAIQNGIAE